MIKDLKIRGQMTEENKELKSNEMEMVNSLISRNINIIESEVETIDISQMKILREEFSHMCYVILIEKNRIYL